MIRIGPQIIHSDNTSYNLEFYLRACGVTDSLILTTLKEIPRSNYVPTSIAGATAWDEVVILEPGRILFPLLFLGLFLMHLAPLKGLNVLIIGGGLGYTGAVISALGGTGSMIESSPTLFERQVPIPTMPCYLVESLKGGYPNHAPYDIIWIEGGTQTLPGVLYNQLTHCGRIVTIQNGKGVILSRMSDRIVSNAIFDGTVDTIAEFSTSRFVL